MSNLVDRLRTGAASPFADEPVRFAYLFGSQATGTARPNSDIDIAVMLEDVVPPASYLDESLRLARLLASATRLPRIEALIILNSARLSLAGRIRQQRIIIYTTDESGRVRYESAIARQFHDFQIHAVPRDQERLRAIASGRA